ncbi:MAG: PIN domain-containing protein [Thermoplasmata archaeon]|nr:PIN domain-containing protein [Thermoplasmata archaeon]MCI4361772.1 PIN domain-containing protein [Thermoplasmata archaeon]
MASLDSTFLIDLLRGVPAAVDRLERLEKRREPRCVTPPAATEVMVGACAFGGSSLRAAEDLIRSLQWLEFDWESCRLAGRIEADLIARGEPMSAADLFIAAVSLRHGQRLLTRDRGFARVPGLKVETY